LHIFKQKSSHLQSFGFQTHTYTQKHGLESLETHKNIKRNLHMCNYLFLSKILAYMMMQWPNYGISKLLKNPLCFLFFWVSKSLNPKSFSCSFNNLELPCICYPSRNFKHFSRIPIMNIKIMERKRNKESSIGKMKNLAFTTRSSNIITLILQIAKVSWTFDMIFLVRVFVALDTITRYFWKKSRNSK